jgi:DNA-directed RNA polymerase I and III subunit RPAC1
MESESAYEPQALMFEAIKVMRQKIATIRKATEGLLGDADTEMAAT